MNKPNDKDDKDFQLWQEGLRHERELLLDSLGIEHIKSSPIGAQCVLGRTSEIDGMLRLPRLFYHLHKQIRPRHIVMVEGRKGTGMMLSSVALTFKLQEHFGKRVINNYNPKPFWDVYNNTHKRGGP